MIEAGDRFPVAIISRNKPAFYCVPAKAFEDMMHHLEDCELNATAVEFSDQASVK
jgi:antitoxin StbD